MVIAVVLSFNRDSEVVYNYIRHLCANDTIRDAILLSAQKLTLVSLIYRTTTNN